MEWRLFVTYLLNDPRIKVIVHRQHGCHQLNCHRHHIQKTLVTPSNALETVWNGASQLAGKHCCMTADDALGMLQQASRQAPQHILCIQVLDDSDRQQQHSNLFNELQPFKNLKHITFIF